MKIQGMDLVVNGIDKICNWLGLGDTDNVFSSAELKNSPNPFGETWEGGWQLDEDFRIKYNDKKGNGYQSFKDYVGHRGDRGFGDFIMNELGAGYQANDFIKFLYEDKQAESFRDYVDKSTFSGVVTTEEQEKTKELLQQMYELWKDALSDKLIVYESQ